MASLTGKLGVWEVPHAHMWKDRRTGFLVESTPLVGLKTRIATIGSCFAAELAAAMARLKLGGAMHPGGLFYTSRSIRQEMERIFEGNDPMQGEKLWEVESGYVHPFRPGRHFSAEEDLVHWSRRIDRESDELFRNADVVVVTLGLIESWVSPRNGMHYLSIPHPDVFPGLGARFHRLTVGEIREDLEAIRRLVGRYSKARLIVTVSPVPLHATLTRSDVRVANAESKARIRAAVSEFVEQNTDVAYFHSYEIVSTAEVMSDFMLEDGRHVHRHAVDYIVSSFLEQFGDGTVPASRIDTSWLTPPRKVAARRRETLISLSRLRNLAMRVLGSG